MVKAVRDGICIQIFCRFYRYLGGQQTLNIHSLVQTVGCDDMNPLTIVVINKPAQSQFIDAEVRLRTLGLIFMEKSVGHTFCYKKYNAKSGALLN